MPVLKATYSTPTRFYWQLKDQFKYLRGALRSRNNAYFAPTWRWNARIILRRRREKTIIALRDLKTVPLLVLTMEMYGKFKSIDIYDCLITLWWMCRANQAYPWYSKACFFRNSLNLSTEVEQSFWASFGLFPSPILSSSFSKATPWLSISGAVHGSLYHLEYCAIAHLEIMKWQAIMHGSFLSI